MTVAPTSTGLMMSVGPDVPLLDVLAVLDAAAADLRRRGITQWPDRFDPDGSRVATIRREIDRGNTFLVRHHQMPVATVTLSDQVDVDFADGWTDGVDDAVYITRLATIPQARALTGLSLGSLLLDHARQVAALRGVGKVRLDCSRTNDALHAYYQRNGFTHVATVEVPGRKSGALFEWRRDGDRPRFRHVVKAAMVGAPPS